MDSLQRKEILQILDSMGVGLPPATKLSLEDLDKRLRDALNDSQRKEKLPRDLSSLPPWLWPFSLMSDEEVYRHVPREAQNACTSCQSES